VWLLVLMPLLCAGAWKQDGKPVPDTAWAKWDGDFGAQLVLSDKPDAFFMGRHQPAPVELLADVPGKAVRGKHLVAWILFTGCAPAENGKCDVRVRFDILGPAGQPYGKPLESDLWVNRQPPAAGLMQLSPGNIGVVIEPQDPLGTYAVTARLTDRVSKKSLVLERRFEAVAAPVK
jgi:hypothetical protein